MDSTSQRCTDVGLESAIALLLVLVPGLGVLAADDQDRPLRRGLQARVVVGIGGVEEEAVGRLLAAQPYGHHIGAERLELGMQKREPGRRVGGEEHGVGRMLPRSVSTRQGSFLSPSWFPPWTATTRVSS